MSERARAVEVAVVGLGIMGACTLWRLAARGVAAAGFDRYEPPHDRGQSHGRSRMVRRIQFEGEQYVPLGELAYRLWAELEHRSGETLLHRTGLLIVGPRNSQLIRGGVESARRSGVAYEILDTAVLRARYPQHLVAEGDQALLDPEAGFISPERATTAALAQAKALGAEVRANCEVRSLAEDGDGMLLETAAGPVRARSVVVAAGGWLGTLLPALAPAITVERHFFTWVPVEDRTAYTADVFPMYIRENSVRSHAGIEESHAHRDRIAGFGFPAEGSDARIKVGFPVTGVAVASPEIDPAPRPEELAAVARLPEMLAGVGGEGTGFTVCCFDNTPDSDFIIGSPSGRRGVVALGGFSGHGFKHAPAVGEIAAALATGEPQPVVVAGWSPDRFSR